MTPDLRGRHVPGSAGGGPRSGWRDLNPRPLAPKASALPSCATPRGERQVYASLSDRAPRRSSAGRHAMDTRSAARRSGFSTLVRAPPVRPGARGRSSMAEPQSSKLTVRVRFSSPALSSFSRSGPIRLTLSDRILRPCHWRASIRRRGSRSPTCRPVAPVRHLAEHVRFILEFAGLARIERIGLQTRRGPPRARSTRKGHPEWARSERAPAAPGVRCGRSRGSGCTPPRQAHPDTAATCCQPVTSTISAAQSSAADESGPTPGRL